MTLALSRVLIARVALVASLLAPFAQIDGVVQRRVQAIRHPLLEPLMKGLTELGESRNFMAVMLAFACFGGPESPAIVRRLIVVLVPMNVAVEVTKIATNRTRPDGDPNPRNKSFPSSHAANSAAVAYVLARRWKRWAPAFWALAIAVSFSRIYLNRHFLSDVLGGMAIGLGIAWLVFRLIPGWRGSWAAPARGGPARMQ